MTLLGEVVEGWTGPLGMAATECSKFCVLAVYYIMANSSDLIHQSLSVLSVALHQDE